MPPVTVLSENTLPIPELADVVQAVHGFNLIATANDRDRGVNELSAALRRRFKEVRALRADGLPTLPSTIAVERTMNPFLRADDPALQQAVGLEDYDPVAAFAEIRRRKDVF